MFTRPLFHPRATRPPSVQLRPTRARVDRSSTTGAPSRTDHPGRRRACLDSAPMDHVDVLILGAGLSGIGAACHLETERPGTTYAVLEARDAMGGTWDLFRYPGVRSDSDMFTLGYSLRTVGRGQGHRRRPVDPRLHPHHGPHPRVEDRIRYRRRALSASWSTPGRPMDGRRRAHRHRRPRAGHLRLPVGQHRLLPLRRGLPAPVGRRGAVRRARSSTPSTGRTTSSGGASGSSSSAAGRRPSPSCPPWPSGRPT